MQITSERTVLAKDVFVLYIKCTPIEITHICTSIQISLQTGSERYKHTYTMNPRLHNVTQSK